MFKLRKLLRISRAADHPGVSPNSIRNWERVGKIAVHLHPVNHCRHFKGEELDLLLRQADRPTKQRQTKA
ncbi:MAG: hypothetical protein U0840_11005 [Gemmataceae bacterium]